MLVLTRRITASTWDVELPLPFEQRQKGRLRTRLPDGEEVAWFLERGQPLRLGEFLQAEDGRVARIVALPEKLLHVTCKTSTDLVRAAYHLGNRHVALQVGNGWLRLPEDYVLRQMLEQMGAQVSQIEAPFDPETGAYGAHHHDGNELGHRGIIHQFGGPAKR
jgi:urease accessory protein